MASTLTAKIFLHFRVADKMALEILVWTMKTSIMTVVENLSL